MTGEPTAHRPGAKPPPTSLPVLSTALALLLVVLLSACYIHARARSHPCPSPFPPHSAPATRLRGLTVFAASSLKDAFTEAGQPVQGG